MVRIPLFCSMKTLEKCTEPPSSTVYIQPTPQDYTTLRVRRKVQKKTSREDKWETTKPPSMLSDDERMVVERGRHVFNIWPIRAPVTNYNYYKRQKGNHPILSGILICETMTMHILCNLQLMNRKTPSVLGNCFCHRISGLGVNRKILWNPRPKRLGNNWWGGGTLVLCVSCGFQRGVRVDEGVNTAVFALPTTICAKLAFLDGNLAPLPVKLPRHIPPLQILTNVDNRWAYWGSLLMSTKTIQKIDNRCVFESQFRLF